MDDNKELANAKWLLGCIVVFLVSCFFVYDEFCYLIWSREAPGTITKVYTSTTRRGTVLNVDYTFTEADKTARRGTVVLSDSWSPPPGNTVTVQYTPGELGRSRLAGTIYRLPIIIFGVSLLAVLVVIVRLVREANDAYRPRKPKRTRS
jgi:hypothetical protein